MMLITRFALAVLTPALALGWATGSAQDVAPARSVPLQNFGWAPGFEGGAGSVTYVGVNDPFQATIQVDGLLPNHEYAVVLQGIAVNGTATTNDSSFIITTNGVGRGSAEVSLALPVGEGVPAYQVHVLIVDRSQPLTEPLPNPLGIPYAIPLACNFPLGFRVGDPATAAPVADDTTIGLVNFGFAPGFEGGGGSVTWGPQGQSFEANVTATGLLPNHAYKIYVLAGAVDGSTTLDTIPVTTDAAGAASAHVSLAPPTAGLPVPAFQVHILVVDETITLEEPLPNPLGIPHPIALACEFPAGFLALPAPAAAPAALPSTGSGGLADPQSDGTPYWLMWGGSGAALATFVAILGTIMVRRSTRRTK